jgi:uncharacterized protein (TIGR02588 family)
VPYEPLSGDGDRTGGQDGSDGQDDQGRGATRAERVLGGLGTLLVVGLLCFLAYQAVWPRGAAPDLRTTVSTVEQVGDQWAVRFTVENSGGGTAENVTVVGEITREGRTLGQSSTTIDYLPPHSRRDGTLLFDTDPDDGTLAVRTAGFTRS